jgi:hypothetical protein
MQHYLLLKQMVHTVTVNRIKLKVKLHSTYLVAKFVLIQRVSDC